MLIKFWFIATTLVPLGEAPPKPYFPTAQQCEAVKPVNTVCKEGFRITHSSNDVMRPLLLRGRGVEDAMTVYETASRP